MRSILSCLFSFIVMVHCQGCIKKIVPDQTEQVRYSYCPYYSGGVDKLFSFDQTLSSKADRERYAQNFERDIRALGRIIIRQVTAPTEIKEMRQKLSYSDDPMAVDLLALLIDLSYVRFDEYETTADVYKATPLIAPLAFVGTALFAFVDTATFPFAALDKSRGYGSYADKPYYSETGKMAKSLFKDVYVHHRSRIQMRRKSLVWPESGKIEVVYDLPKNEVNEFERGQKLAAWRRQLPVKNDLEKN